MTNHTRAAKALRLALLISSFIPYCFAAEKEHAKKRTLEEGESSLCKKIKVQDDTVAQLHTAVEQGDLETVKFLIASGTDKEAQNNEGLTPFHTAAWNGHLDIVIYLLQQGAFKEALTKNSCTPLYIAAGRGHLAIVDYLLKAGADKDSPALDKGTPLCLASFKGHLDIVTRLLKEGAAKDTQAEDGRTSLHTAVYKDHAEVVDCLLKAGADHRIRTNYGLTPLHVAALQGHNASLEYLLRSGADKEAQFKNGFTPLHLAAEKGHLSAVDHLLKAGVDKNAVNKMGRTALHTAAAQGHLSIIKILLSHGVSINAEDIKGFSAFHYTIRKALDGEEKQRAVLDYLLEAGADCSPEQKTKSLTRKLLFERKRDDNGFLTEEPALYIIKKLLDEGTDLPVSNPPLCDALRTAQSRGDAPAATALEAELIRRREELDPAERAKAMISMIRDACDLDERGLAQFVQQSAQSSRDARLLKTAQKNKQ